MEWNRSTCFASSAVLLVSFLLCSCIEDKQTECWREIEPDGGTFAKVRSPVVFHRDSNEPVLTSQECDNCLLRFRAGQACESEQLYVRGSVVSGPKRYSCFHDRWYCGSEDILEKISISGYTGAYPKNAIEVSGDGPDDGPPPKLTHLFHYDACILDHIASDTLVLREGEAKCFTIHNRLGSIQVEEESTTSGELWFRNSWGELDLTIQ